MALGPAKFLTWSFSGLTVVVAISYCILFLLGRGGEVVERIRSRVGDFTTQQVALERPFSGTFFTNYPRKVELSWRELSGAAAYQVDVQWRAPPGVPSDFESLPRYPVITEGARHSLEFPGDNPGRWRVTALN